MELSFSVSNLSGLSINKAQLNSPRSSLEIQIANALLNNFSFRLSMAHPPPRASPTDAPDAFFRAWRHLARDWDERVRALSVQGAVLTTAPKGVTSGGSEPAELAEDMLEAVQAMSQRAPGVSTALDNALQDLECFLDESRRQFQDLWREVAKYERWAGQYGYTPQLGPEEWLTWTWDQILTPVVVEEVEAPPEEGDQASSERDDAPPTIFESGVSQETLKALGYKFKEQIAPVQEPVASLSIDTPTPPPLKPAFVSETPRSAHRSFALTSDDDSGPLPIMKKPAVTLTPAFHPGDQSRVEITPGLFVRKPKTKSTDKVDPSTNRILASSAVPLQAFQPTENTPTPQRPQLTVDIQRILAQARQAENSAPTHRSECLPTLHPHHDDLTPSFPAVKSLFGQRLQRARDENVQPELVHDPDNVTPEMPNLSSKKGQRLVHLSAQKAPPKSKPDHPSPPSLNEPELDSPGPPQRPQLQTEALGLIRDRVW